MGGSRHFFFFKIAQNLICCSWGDFQPPHILKLHARNSYISFKRGLKRRHLAERQKSAIWAKRTLRMAWLCYLMNFDRSYVGVWKIFGFFETFRKMHLECRFWPERQKSAIWHKRMLRVASLCYLNLIGHMLGFENFRLFLNISQNASGVSISIRQHVKFPENGQFRNFPLICSQNLMPREP